MECGRLLNATRWSAYSFASTSSDANTPAVYIEDCPSDEQCAVNDNYLITFPDDDSDASNNNSNEYKLNRFYENPLFISAGEVLKAEISDDNGVELMKSEAKKLGDYKFCEAVNDFDIELEAGEAVPIVYLSSTRAAKLQRALRLAGYKKVSFLSCFRLFCINFLFNFPYEIIFIIWFNIRMNLSTVN